MKKSYEQILTRLLAVIVAQQEALYKKLDDNDRQTTRMKIIEALKVAT